METLKKLKKSLNTKEHTLQTFLQVRDAMWIRRGKRARQGLEFLYITLKTIIPLL